MKRTLIPLLMLLAWLQSGARVSDEAFARWHSGKFSMFIHFGLYSHLGGVWEGEPVRRGYSEQIQSFAGIFSDWYGETAREFDPVEFNADSIASLALRAGMKSVVMTAKHHDGFCMFATSTTPYNSVRATPARRDFIAEMAEACRRAGLRFGIYFSLIDWHFPHAYPISSHNCDFITPQHHELNKAQVRELLSSYGPVSELWFDMGSNTPAQSRELYALVHELQPDCMVSGRLGNDCCDFAVMADNAYPDGTLVTPWQSAASMFDETWSYRSWQVMGEAADKIAERLRNLVSVVSHGGNFLLNIGPTGSGAVVPFEAEVLEGMGRWLARNADAVYSTEASPFRDDFPWGKVTRRDSCLYLILSGNVPSDGYISLPRLPGKILSSSAPYAVRGDSLRFKAPVAADRTDIAVIRLRYDRPVSPRPGKPGVKYADFGFSGFDFASNYQSEVACNWHFARPFRSLLLTYTPQEEGSGLLVEVDGDESEVLLSGEERIPVGGNDGLAWGGRYLCSAPGRFDSPAVLELDSLRGPRGVAWKPYEGEGGVFTSGIMDNLYMLQDVVSPDDRELVLEVGAGNGVELFLNGRRVMKHLNPYRTTERRETVRLNLPKGRNRILLRSYNRFEDEAFLTMKPADEQVILRQRVKLPRKYRGGSHEIKVRRKGLPSANADTELSNLQLKVE